MEEILMNILSRLPVKSLIRFHCVSKFWKALIGEPYFKNKHLNHAKNQLSSQNLLFLELINIKRGELSSLSVSLVMEDIPIIIDHFASHSYPIEIDDIKLYSSCDGLFLIGIWTEFVEQPSILVIWNPSTWQAIRLAHTRFPQQIDEDADRGSTYGLAYDSSIDDYKIFRVDITGDKGNEILALKNGSWRIIDGKTGHRVLLRGEFVAFVDGAFHWIGFLSKACVISFNISDETYGEISLPDMISAQLPLSQFYTAQVLVDFHVGVSVLRGMLGFYYKDDKNFNLWVMKKYGTWMKWLSIPSAGFYSIVPVYAFSDDEMLLRFDQDRSECIYRKISAGSSMFSFQFTCCVDGFPYTETLIFPDLGHSFNFFNFI